MKDDRGELDLTFLAEQHAKEIWALKEQISKQSEEFTVLRGTKQVVAQLSNELVRMKKRAQEAEGELTIIKGKTAMIIMIHLRFRLFVFYCCS